MKKGSKEMFSSGRNEKKRKKAGFRRVFLLSGLILLLLSGCGSGSTSGTMLYGKTWVDQARQDDALNIQNVRAKQREKYERHFQNGLYFEDLSQAQKELNDHFHAMMEKEIENYVNTQAPFLKGVPHILKTQVEYVNADAKAYAQGRKKAEEIIDNPEAMMRLRIYWYLFEDFRSEKQKKEKEEFAVYRGKGSTLLEKVWQVKYRDAGVEDFETRIQAYHPDVLKKYSLEKIKQASDIDLFLQGEDVTMALYLYKTPYHEMFFENRESRGWIYRKKARAEQSRRLKEKYNIDFVHYHDEWYMPRGKPELFFVDWEHSDHFQSLMYQYLLNQRIRKMIDDAGLSDRVVFLVTTEPMTTPPESTHERPYDFGEGFNEDYFLRRGYTGIVYVNLIYLEGEEPSLAEYGNGYFRVGDEEQYLYRAKWETEREKRLAPIEKLLEETFRKPLDEQIYFGCDEYEENGLKRTGSCKSYRWFVYHVDDYERRVVVDLFRNYPITERDENPRPASNGLDLSDVFSEKYKIRAETQGFHYLDIFGELY